MLHCQPRIFRLHDALDDQLAAPVALDFGHIVPAQRRVELLGGPGGERADIADAAGVADDVAEGAALRTQHTQAPARLGGQVDQVGQRGLGRGAQAVLDVLVALAQYLQVQREYQRRAVGGAGAVDQAKHEIAITHDVELEPEWVAAGGLGHILDRADAHGGEGEGHAKVPGGARGQHFAIGVLHAGQAGGGQIDRHAVVLAEQRGAGAAVFQIHRDALAELDAAEVVLVGAVGAFGVRAGIGIVVEHARHARLGQLAQVFDTGDGGHGVLLDGISLWPAKSSYYANLRRQ